MQHAKAYIDKMANGIDPLTDQPVADTDCINQVRISRCLFYVSDVLRRVIENGGNIGKTERIKKQPFMITHETLNAFSFSTTPIPVSEITRRINELVDSTAMTKLKYTSINTFLLKSGFLMEQQSGDEKKRKVPTEQGQAIGIVSEERVGQSGTYYVTVYNTDAQQFILDNIEAITEVNNQKTVSTVDQAELQGQPWTSNYDEALTDLFKKNVPVSEIAITLKRTENAIRVRLKKLGFIEKSSDAN